MANYEDFKVKLSPAQLEDFNSIILSLQLNRSVFLEVCNSHSELNKSEVISLIRDLEEFQSLFLDSGRPFSMFFLQSFIISFTQLRDRLLSVGLLPAHSLIVMLSNSIVTFGLFEAHFLDSPV